MKTVAVIEGFFGGPLHTRGFRQALEQAGFRIVKKPGQADIIIAHSAGIYSFPPDCPARLVILIGPTFWPGKHLVKRVSQHAKTSRRYHVKEFGWLFYIQKELLGLFYFFKRHRYMWYGILNNDRLDRIKRIAAMPGRKTIIIRNSDDPFTAPEYKEHLKDSKARFVDMPGVHDHFVMNPEPYIHLIQKELS